MPDPMGVQYLLVVGQPVVIGNWGLQGSQKVHLGLKLAFEDAQPFLFALLTLGLTQNLEFVAGGVVGLDKELQGILSYHFVQLRQKSFKSARKGKSHNRKTLRFHEFFGPRSQKIVKLLCYRHAEIFFRSNHRLKRSE